MESRTGLPRWLVLSLFGLAAAAATWAFRAAVTPCLFAFFLAYALDPVVDTLERRGISRGWGIALIFGVVIAFVAVFVVLVVPRIARDLADFATRLPGYVNDVIARARPSLARLGVDMPSETEQIAGRFELDLRALANEGLRPAGTFFAWFIGGTASFVGSIVAGLIVPVLAIYFLLDFDIIVARSKELVPFRWRSTMFGIAHDVDVVVSQFLRGQIIVMGALAVLYALAYSIVGIQLAIPIGLVAGLLSFIPYVGSAMALGLALVMAIFEWTGWGTVAAVLIAHFTVQFLEGFVITPRVMGGQVGLSSVWVMIAIMAGGAVGGFLGVLVAVPAAAVLKIFIVRGLDAYKRSHFFNEGRSLESIGVRESSVPEVRPLAIDVSADLVGPIEPLREDEPLDEIER